MNYRQIKEELLNKFAVDEKYDADNHLYCYAIIRGDLNMPKGKAGAQAGHAYTDTIRAAQNLRAEIVEMYFNKDLGGSKILLKARNENQLIRAYLDIKKLGIPCAIIIDKNHILPPHFDGKPIITALGIGPCKRSEINNITKKFNCL